MKVIIITLTIFAVFAGCSDGIVSECPDSIKDVSIRPVFSSIQSELFNKNCATSGCHSGSIPAAGLVLSSGASYNNIVDKIAFGDTKYIAPGDPENSWLYQRVNSTTSSVMPPTGRLPQNVIDTLRVWIENGALNN